MLAILIILIFLTNLASHSQPKHNRSRRKDVLAKVSGVVRLLLTSRDQQLLVPLTVVGGITMAFIAGDFTVVQLTLYVLDYNVLSRTVLVIVGL